MIRLWISRESSISIREQLSSQLLLGILSRRLAPGEKLPSVRELARRLDIHGNTVQGIYRDLAKRGWLQARPGSGVFVVELRQPISEAGIDDLVSSWILEAETKGYSVADIQAAFERQSQPVEPQQFIVVDPDPELASSATCGQAALGFAPDTCVIATQGHATEVAASIGNTPLRLIQLRSMQDVLKGRQRPPFPILIAIVSRSKSILAWASTLLSALGFEPENVLFRNPMDKSRNGI